MAIVIVNMSRNALNLAALFLAASGSVHAAQLTAPMAASPVASSSASPAFTHGYTPTSQLPPQVQREFRAAWISSVGENSWLAQLTGKSTAEQKAALIAMLDRAQQLRLNTIIFQVRPSCDAVYASSIEPWSEYVTGIQGRAPQPFYDPLEFVIEEAHKRGLEVHAWFNPYRAHHADAKSPIAPNHISRTRPDLVRSYGKYLWLDPGERDVQDYSIRVILDVVKRYDIDGVHLDDYFYPYMEKDYAGRPVDFPDNVSWRKYGANSGLGHADWRRENVNTFIQRADNSIHTYKPWVKFGISPFGIWRPGNPPQIRGKDAYSELFADSRKWIAHGWADYFSPQLYWDSETREQSFPVLLKWWDDQNLQHRGLWPGIDTTKVQNGKWTPDEIIRQIRLSRGVEQPGQVFWGMKDLMYNPGGLDQRIYSEVYTAPALVPVMPWLAGTNAPPARPLLAAKLEIGSVKLDWVKTDTSNLHAWLLQRRVNGVWLTDILPATRTGCELSGQPELIAVTAVDRIGRTSPPATMQLLK